MNQVLIFGVGVIIGAGAVWYFLGGGGNRETLKEKQIKEKSGDTSFQEGQRKMGAVPKLLNGDLVPTVDFFLNF